MCQSGLLVPTYKTATLTKITLKCWTFPNVWSSSLSCSIAVASDIYIYFLDKLCHCGMSPKVYLRVWYPMPRAEFECRGDRTTRCTVQPEDLCGLYSWGCVTGWGDTSVLAAGSVLYVVCSWNISCGIWSSDGGLCWSVHSLLYWYLLLQWSKMRICDNMDHVF